MRIVLIVGSLLLGCATFAQDQEPTLTPELTHITLHQSPSLTLLLEEHRDFMQRLQTLPGYRIQLTTTTRLQSANQFRMAFSKKFPDLKVYILFNEPNYRVRVGDLTHRVDARHLLEQIQEEYPEAIVVKDQINLSAL